MIRRRFGVRKPIPDDGTADHKLPYSQQSLSIVLRDWKIISESYGEVALKIFLAFITDYPKYRKLFPGLHEADDDDLEFNKVFVSHAFGIMNAITTVLHSLTGEYEDDGELLPVIGRSHRKRGITFKMFKDLKESLLSVCFQHLRSDKRSRAAWTDIINFIFDYYLGEAYKRRNS